MIWNSFGVRFTYSPCTSTSFFLSLISMSPTRTVARLRRFGSPLSWIFARLRPASIRMSSSWPLKGFAT